MPRYCMLCERYVEPTKKFNWAVFLLLLFLTLGFGALIYLLYYICKTSSNCPICGSYLRKGVTPPQSTSTAQPARNVSQPQHHAKNYCPSCGSSIT
ncbi:MAG: hypothetical protein ACFFCJ_08160, partial [Promethearchaeota archaeon]